MQRGSWLSMLQRLRKDRRGAILPMAAVTALIMLMLAGLAIDVSLIISAKNRVRRAMDAAGIAIATNFRGNEAATQEEVEAFTINWMQSNYPNYKIGEYFNLSVSWVDGQADISARVKVDTLFMDVIGASEINADVDVRVISETRGLEVALALDNTGTMNGTELNWLIFSVSNFLDVLYTNAPDTSQVKVGFVPFVAAVNVKSPEDFPTNWIDPANPEDVPWLDDGVTSLVPTVSYHGDYYNPRVSHAYLYKLAATANGDPHWYDRWKGCVEARAVSYDGNELDVTDVPPDPARPETLWVPYLWPDGPDLGGNLGTKDSGDKMITSDASLWSSGDPIETPNNYLNDLVDASFTWTQRLESIASWLNVTEVSKVASSDEIGPITTGPSMACPEPILPLTSNVTYLKDQIQKKGRMQVFSSGGTNFAQGLMWAWRILSAAPPFTQGAEYLNPDGTVNKKFDKVIIMFVDARGGGNGAIFAGNPKYSTYTAYGFAEPDGRLDPMGVNDLNTKTLKACQNARAPADGASKEKIVIYAIGFGGTDSDPVTGILEQCTGDPNRVYTAANTSELYQIFASLAEQLTKLRVVY